MTKPSALAIVFLILPLLSACESGEEETAGSAAQTAEEIAVERDEASEWASYGRSADEQRYSPLAGINTENVSELGVAWSTPLDANRGNEATPLVVDGIMYTTSAWSVVYALDGRDGSILWKFDPEVPRWKAGHACCDVVNRGVALHEDKVFVGTIDGRLIAIDRKTGSEKWSVRTFDIETPRTITGAPRVVKGNVIIGHGGAEFGVRGYVSAYDAETGEMAWRFHTVPGNPADGHESETMAMAAETWNGEWWKLGGGGTVWDSMAFDAELDLLYIGVGNGSPWNQKVRSPGGGDNLFLSSIVAVRPDTGEYVWHYQTTPGETWDYTATQSIILADLEIEGVTRKVIMQAPKNGFYYVIDRGTGEFISAKNFVEVNWASHIDETGRPVETANARYLDGPSIIKPSPFGAHNWHPMSFNPELGLAYIPAQDLPFFYQDQFGTDIARIDHEAMNLGVPLSIADLPPTRDERRAMLKQLVRGSLIAWDPANQTEAWRVDYDQIWNGGTLTTAGNLVFQGRADQSFAAYDASTGSLLWEMPVDTSIMGGPVTYEIDGEQYIAASGGWGSGMPLLAGYASGQTGAPQVSHVIAFKIGGDAELNIEKVLPGPIPAPPEVSTDEDRLEQGRLAYVRFCLACHGESVISGGVTPDLRYSATLGNEGFYAFVMGGASVNGMPDFGDRLSRDEAEMIHDYVIHRAWLGYDDQ